MPSVSIAPLRFSISSMHFSTTIGRIELVALTSVVKSTPKTRLMNFICGSQSGGARSLHFLCAWKPQSWHLTPCDTKPHMKLRQKSHQCGPLKFCGYTNAELLKIMLNNNCQQQKWYDSILELWIYAVSPSSWCRIGRKSCSTWTIAMTTMLSDWQTYASIGGHCLPRCHSRNDLLLRHHSHWRAGRNSMRLSHFCRRLSLDDCVV